MSGRVELWPRASHARGGSFSLVRWFAAIGLLCISLVSLTTATMLTRLVTAALTLAATDGSSARAWAISGCSEVPRRRHTRR